MKTQSEIREKQAAQLKAYRKSKGWSQAQMARKLGMKLEDYRPREEGRAKLPGKILPAFAELMGEKLMDLIKEY